MLALRQDVPNALVSPHAMSRILTLAKSLPPCPLAGFECRLGAKQSSVDFQVEVPRRPYHPPTQRLEDRLWEFLQAFCDEWVDDSSNLSRSVAAVGLEFDIHRDPVPPPAMFVALSRAAMSDRELLIATIARLMGQASLPTETAVRTCLRALPEGATIKFVGTMPSRGSNALRVNVAGIPTDRITDYLRSLGWPYPTIPLASTIATVSEATDDLILCLDLTDRVLPRIGIECILREQPPRDPRWNRLLNYLMTIDVCSDSKRQALLIWHGDTLRSQSTHYWPRNLELGDKLLGPVASTFYRYLSHIKLVHQPDRPVEAKAYLGFFHQWIDMNGRGGHGRRADAHQMLVLPWRNHIDRLGDRDT